MPTSCMAYLPPSLHIYMYVHEPYFSLVRKCRRGLVGHFCQGQEKGSISIKELCKDYFESIEAQHLLLCVLTPSLWISRHLQTTQKCTCTV